MEMEGTVGEGEPGCLNRCLGGKYLVSSGKNCIRSDRVGVKIIFWYLNIFIYLYLSFIIIYFNIYNGMIFLGKNNETRRD